MVCRAGTLLPDRVLQARAGLPLLSKTKINLKNHWKICYFWGHSDSGQATFPEQLSGNDRTGGHLDAGKRKGD